MRYTPIQNVDQKIDIIEHVNEDHLKEMLAIARVYVDSDISAVVLADLFEEGMVLRSQEAGGREQEHFIAFLSEGDLHGRVRHLAMSAIKQLGSDFADKADQFFEVLELTQPSLNMRRLILQSRDPIPLSEPGYAWCFSLTALSRQTQSDWAAQCENPLRRYYTLRKGELNAQGKHIAVVDVFTHGDSPGSLWINSLKRGDILHSRGDYHEHTDHLGGGQCVLIGDETALPTVAKLLEEWQNPVAPIVISICHDEADQAYFDEALAAKAAKVWRIGQSKNADQLIAILDQIPQIDGIWGGLEHHVGKQLRSYLRNRRQLASKQMKIKGYWIDKAA